MTSFNLMILAAGYGKRMENLTENIPKPLLKINNTTLLSNTINFFYNLGCNQFVINTHYLHNQINNYININHSNKNITISKQDTIISNLNLQIKNFNNAIKLQDQKFLTSQKLSQELEVALKKSKRQTKLYKIGTIVGGVAIGILIIK